MESGDHADILNLRLLHSLAGPKCFLIRLGLPELQGDLLRIHLVGLSLGGQRDILSPDYHLLVDPTRVRKFPGPQHEEPRRQERRLDHPAVDFELPKGLGPSYELLAKPLEHLYGDPQSPRTLDRMLLQRVEDDPETVHLRSGIPMSRSLVGVLDGEDSLLHGHRRGAQPSQVAQISEDLVLILDRVTSMVKVGG